MASSGRSASGRIFVCRPGRRRRRWPGIPKPKLVGPRFDDREVVEVVAMEPGIAPAPARLLADRLGTETARDRQHPLPPLLEPLDDRLPRQRRPRLAPPFVLVVVGGPREVGPRWPH